MFYQLITFIFVDLSTNFFLFSQIIQKLATFGLHCTIVHLKNNSFYQLFPSYNLSIPLHTLSHILFKTLYHKMAILMFLQNYKPYNPCCKILGRGGGGHYHILDFLLEKKLN